MRTPNGGSAARTVNPGSMLFKLAVEQYVCHSHLAFADQWTACRARRCPVQAHAAGVIHAAGIDPASYDPPPRRPAGAGHAWGFAYYGCQKVPGCARPLILAEVTEQRVWNRLAVRHYGLTKA
jgi:hypothetical protein